MGVIGHYIARRYLSRMNAVHLRSYPQLAAFSFDLITLYIHLDGRYERDELQFLADRVFPALPPGGDCLDVGANIGNHAVTFAPHFRRVIAFEPHPRTFRLLELNAELAGNIVPLNLGASSGAGTITVAQDRRNIAATSIKRQGGPGSDSVSFRLERIDDIAEVAQSPAISFMKFDVEGHERQALEGAAETIRRHRPLIVLEVLPDEVESGTTESVEFLRMLGYRHFYELTGAGWLGRLPRRLLKPARTLVSVLTGRRPSKAENLTEVTTLEKRSYLMLLCAPETFAPVG